MNIPDTIHPNDLMDALRAGIDAIRRDPHKTAMADYRIHTLSQFLESVQREARQ